MTNEHGSVGLPGCTVNLSGITSSHPVSHLSETCIGRVFLATVDGPRYCLLAFLPCIHALSLEKPLFRCWIYCCHGERVGMLIPISEGEGQAHSEDHHHLLMRRVAVAEGAAHFVLLVSSGPTKCSWIPSKDPTVPRYRRLLADQQGTSFYFKLCISL